MMDLMLGWQSKQHITVEIASSRFRAFSESISCHLIASGVLPGLFNSAHGDTQLRRLRSIFLDGEISNRLVDDDD